MYDDLSQNLSYRESALLLFNWVFGFSTGSIDSIFLDEENEAQSHLQTNPKSQSM